LVAGERHRVLLRPQGRRDSAPGQFDFTFFLVRRLSDETVISVAKCFSPAKRSDAEGSPGIAFRSVPSRRCIHPVGVPGGRMRGKRRTIRLR
jgi:hypothetical protein